MFIQVVSFFRGQLFDNAHWIYVKIVSMLDKNISGQSAKTNQWAQKYGLNAI